MSDLGCDFQGQSMSKLSGWMDPRSSVKQHWMQQLKSFPCTSFWSWVGFSGSMPYSGPSHHVPVTFLSQWNRLLLGSELMPSHAHNLHKNTSESKKAHPTLFVRKWYTDARVFFFPFFFFFWIWENCEESPKRPRNKTVIYSWKPVDDTCLRTFLWDDLSTIGNLFSRRIRTTDLMRHGHYETPPWRTTPLPIAARLSPNCCSIKESICL